MSAVLTSRMVLSSAHAKCPTRVCKADLKNRISTPDGLGSLKTVGLLRMKSSPVPVGRLVITKASGTGGGLPSSTTSSGKGMNLVFVGAEVGPWSKTGGLGDVLGGLPPALAALGHRVMTVCPRYDQYADAWDTNVLVEIRVGDRVEAVRFFHCYKRGVDRVFVDHPLFLERVWGKTGSKIYGPVTGIDYGDNQLRFSLMCQVNATRFMLVIESPQFIITFMLRVCRNKGTVPWNYISTVEEWPEADLNPLES